MEFISFDLETTGTLSHADHIVEIGAAKFKDGEHIDSFQSLIKIDVPMPKEAQDIHGITDDMLKNESSLQEVLPNFVNFCGDTLMVAHNAIFDFQFLVRAIQESGGSFPKGLVIDTCHLARKTFPNLINYKLITLCDLLKISSDQFHRAEADAVSCGRLFVQILDKLPFQDIQKIIKFSGRNPLKFPVSASEGQLSLL